MLDLIRLPWGINRCPACYSACTINVLFLLCSFAFAGDGFFGALDLAFEAFDAEVVALGVVDFLLAVAGLAAGAAGVLDVACIALVVALLGLALRRHLRPEVDEMFTVVFYAHNVVVLYLLILYSSVKGYF